MRTRSTKFSILFSLSALFILVGCSGGKPKDLSEADYATLKAINESIADTGAALDLAFEGKFHAASSVEKVQKLANMIRDSNCRQKPGRNEEPGGEDRYNADWKIEKNVEGGTCILDLTRNVSFKADTRTLTHIENFTSTDAFKKESLVHSYTLDGKLTAKTTNASTRIEGDYRFKNFRVEKLGPAWVNIRTVQTLSSSTALGAGTANLFFEAKDLKHNATVRWSGKNSIDYRINGKKVDKKAIQELFSSYGLLELVDRSRRMR